MAENKRSFLLYADLIHTVNKLPDKEAGVLMKLILSYVNDENPDIDSYDFVIQIAFEPIKQQLKRDLQKYQNIVERNKINGSKGGRPKKAKKPSGLTGNPEKPKKADSVNGSDNGNEIKKKYVYNQFYDEQLKLSNNDTSYETFIKWLFGNNLYSRPLKKVLAMTEQVSWEQLPKLIQIHKDTGVKIKPLLEELENWLMKNPKAKNSTVIGTLRTFVKNQQKAK